MTAATMIPALPCVSISETLEFYRLLGFEVTYQQSSPNPYAATRRREGGDLHFYGLKGLKPTEGYSTCLVIVDEVEGLHQRYAAALKGVYGKVPIAGIPRITRMKKGQSRFTVVDPSGNSVIFIRRDEPDSPKGGEAGQGTKSRLVKAIDAAARLRDFKGDDAAAAKVLDVALGRNEPADPVDRARALAARAELAVALGDPERAKALRAELQQIPLSQEEHERLRDELQAADELERSQH